MRHSAFSQCLPALNRWTDESCCVTTETESNNVCDG